MYKLLCIIIFAICVNAQIDSCSYVNNGYYKGIYMMYDGWLYCGEKLSSRKCFHVFDDVQVKRVEWDDFKYTNRYCNVTTVKSTLVEFVCSCPIGEKYQIRVQSKLWIYTNMRPPQTISPTKKPFISDDSKIIIVVFVALIVGTVVLLTIAYCIYSRYRRRSYVNLVY